MTWTIGPLYGVLRKRSPSSGYSLMTDISAVLYRSLHYTAQLQRDELVSACIRIQILVSDSL